MTLSSGDILRQAADHISKHGRVVKQFYGRSADGMRIGCAIGTCNLVAGLVSRQIGPITPVDTTEAILIAGNLLPGVADPATRLIYFNDDPHTADEDVILLFKQGAEVADADKL